MMKKNISRKYKHFSNKPFHTLKTLCFCEWKLNNIQVMYTSIMQPHCTYSTSTAYINQCVLVIMFVTSLITSTLVQQE